MQFSTITLFSAYLQKWNRGDKSSTARVRFQSTRVRGVHPSARWSVCFSDVIGAILRLFEIVDRTKENEKIVDYKIIRL